MLRRGPRRPTQTLDSPTPPVQYIQHHRALDRSTDAMSAVTGMHVTPMLWRLWSLWSLHAIVIPILLYRS